MKLIPYYKDDIIEILNLTGYQEWQLYGEHEERFRKRYLGSRFKISRVERDEQQIEAYKDKVIMCQIICCRNYDHKEDIYFEEGQVMLYHRPLKNTVKNLFNILKELIKRK